MPVSDTVNPKTSLPVSSPVAAVRSSLVRFWALNLSLSLKRYRQFSGFKARPPTSVSLIASRFSVPCFFSFLCGLSFRSFFWGSTNLSPDSSVSQPSVSLSLFPVQNFITKLEIYSSNSARQFSEV
jgi:hypothetical protein